MDLSTSEQISQRGGLRAAALAAWVLPWCICVAAATVYLLERPQWTSDQWFFVVDLADGLVYAPTAWLLLSRSPHLVGWLVGLTALGGSFAALGFQWSQFSATHPGAPALPDLVAMQNWAWIPGTLSLICVIPWLVREGPLNRNGHLMVGLGVALTASFMVARLTDPFPWPAGEPFASLPIRNEQWGSFVDAAFRWQVAALIVLGIAATAHLLGRRRVAPEGKGTGLSWLAAGTLLVTLSFLPLLARDNLAEVLPVALTPLTHLASQLFYPAAVLVVVLGQRMWGVDHAVSRAATWGLLTALLTASYVALVSVLGLVLPDSSGAQQVLATALVAAGFQPLQRRIQRRVNRLVHGYASDPARLWQSVGRQVVADEEPGAVLDQVLATLSLSLRLEGAVIVTGDAAAPRVLAPRGAPADAALRDDTVAVPLSIGSRHVGELVAIPRVGERLDALTIDSVRHLAPIVAATVQLSIATEELSLSRSQVIAAREEERRRLRRELHDGLGPALAGIGLALQASRNLLSSDPAGAGALIEQVIVETDQRVEKVRAMARDLLPPSLDGSELGPALEELARLYRGAGLDLSVDASAVETSCASLRPEVSMAAYAIATEAVRNVARHSSASRCCISIALDGEQVVLAVRDNGVGIDLDSPRGVGMTSMTEWADGVGGAVVVARDEPRGTLVTATLPVWTAERATQGAGERSGAGTGERSGAMTRAVRIGREPAGEPT